MGQGVPLSAPASPSAREDEYCSDRDPAEFDLADSIDDKKCLTWKTTSFFFVKTFVLSASNQTPFYASLAVTVNSICLHYP
jgi:hypothetical protein